MATYSLDNKNAERTPWKLLDEKINADEKQYQEEIADRQKKYEQLAKLVSRNRTVHFAVTACYYFWLLASGLILSNTLYSIFRTASPYIMPLFQTNHRPTVILLWVGIIASGVFVLASFAVIISEMFLPSYSCSETWLTMIVTLAWWRYIDLIEMNRWILAVLATFVLLLNMDLLLRYYNWYFMRDKRKFPRRRIVFLIVVDIIIFVSGILWFWHIGLLEIDLWILALAIVAVSLILGVIIGLLNRKKNMDKRSMITGFLLVAAVSLTLSICSFLMAWISA